MNKKIGILIDRLNVGGVEKIAIEEVRALRKLGEDAYLVVLRRKGVVNSAFSDLRKDLPTIYLDDRLPGLLKISFKFPIFSFFSFFHLTYPLFIPFIVKKDEFDYLIVHGTYTAFTATGLKKIKGLKYSVFIWDPISYILRKAYSGKLSIFLNLFNGLAKILDKSIINNSDFVLVGGSAHNKYIKSITKKVNIKIIPPSVHPLKKLTKTKSDYLVLVTAWKRGKNPEYIFEILKKIPRLKVKIVGKWIEESYKEEFIKKIKKQKLSNNIDVVGEVDERELSLHYERALALLQINDDRGFGMPALEAAGHGTTFIIPKGQGVGELFENQIDGYLTKEKDTIQIVKYITILLKNKKIAIKMGQNGRNKVMEKASWEVHAKDLKKIANKH